MHMMLILKIERHIILKTISLMQSVKIGDHVKEKDL